MPKFYFDVAGKGFRSEAQDPVDLIDAECARQFAEGLAETLQGDDDQPINVVIRDEGGTIVDHVINSYN